MCDLNDFLLFLWNIMKNKFCENLKKINCTQTLLVSSVTHVGVQGS